MLVRHSGAVDESCVLNVVKFLLVFLENHYCRPRARVIINQQDEKRNIGAESNEAVRAGLNVLVRHVDGRDG